MGITLKKKMHCRRQSRRRGSCAHPTHVHSMKPPLIPPGQQSSISSPCPDAYRFPCPVFGLPRSASGARLGLHRQSGLLVIERLVSCPMFRSDPPQEGSSSAHWTQKLCPRDGSHEIRPPWHVSGAATRGGWQLKLDTLSTSSSFALKKERLSSMYVYLLR